ncbi:inactive pancreatic lipase-related protein 1-like isoform X2 [Plodia interpunctella]|uniref:inactive pancreatic lipase-related protein 1-like isoform X2 n=1 Tax=Plodia interpunctella TaxID=58824 RepID=UPI002367511F|nr:inactive pancreatic lipase-related protein 1-like isoform X2 [Plodia interpunctella]
MRQLAVTRCRQRTCGRSAMFRAVTDSWKRYWWGTGILPDRSNRVEDIYLRFYNGNTAEDYVDFPLSQARRLFEIKGFDKNNSTVLYIHGFIETAQQESVQVMVSAYLEARPGTNIVLLDWSNMSHGSYLVNAVRNSKKVGLAAAEQLNSLLEGGLLLDRLHVIGHSLGSHVAGYAARELRAKYSKTIKRLTALDPAFPAFYPDGIVMEHINAKDAEFVDVIHTDAGGYGAPVRTGTADFWPNGGKSVQPGCPRFAPIPLSEDNLCSHWRSWRFFAESVRNPEAFPASPASSYQKFRENPTPEVGMVYMGFNCDTSAQGSYYMTTNGQSPFGKGMEGLYSKGKKHSLKNSK